MFEFVDEVGLIAISQFSGKPRQILIRIDIQSLIRFIFIVKNGHVVRIFIAASRHPNGY